MTIYNLGSINTDHVYLVPHLPGPGETIATKELRIGLGGKGANQSVAAARAGARVEHIGTIGPDGDWTVKRLQDYGVDTRHIATVHTPTAHAIINVDPSGENTIVIFPGANQHQADARIANALARASAEDILMLQNETSHQVEAAHMAYEKGMRVIYSAAPFDADAVARMLPYLFLLILNEIEAQQLANALGKVDVPNMLVTRGAKGAEWRTGAETFNVSGREVSAVDTTGAGDTFAGYLAAGLIEGMKPAQAMALASTAAAIKVTRYGTADAIPTRLEVDTFAH